MKTIWNNIAMPTDHKFLTKLMADPQLQSNLAVFPEKEPWV